MEESKKKTTAVHALEIAREIRPLIRKMYSRAHEAKERGQKVAWVMVGVEPSILKTMDIVSIFPEHWGALCAAKKRERPFLEKAEAEGYSPVSCNYARVSLGFSCLCQETGMVPPDAPEQGMAAPDLLITTSYLCDPRYKFYQALARYKKVPCYNYDFQWPHAYREVKDHYIKYNVTQLRGLIAFLEEQTHRKMDWDRLRENIEIEYESRRIWWEVYKLRKSVPSPMPSEDQFTVMVPFWYLTCEPETPDFYRKLRDEVRYRVENKIGVISDEKYRLIWNSGLPPWHNMWVFNYFESLGAVCAMETPYYTDEPVQPDTSDPLEVLVWRNGRRWHWDWGKHTESELVALIREYKIDGMVTHGLKSCRATTIGQIHEGNVVHQHAKVPTLYIQSDIVDSREYSEAQVKMQIDAFIEVVDSNKKSA